MINKPIKSEKSIPDLRVGRPNEANLNGLLIIDKPRGMTSHDVVDVVRRMLKIQKVGHAGTLDPLATGVLVILIGKATRLFDKFMNFDKTYEAVLTLGSTTTTGDSCGKIVELFPYDKITEGMAKEVIESFLGKISQVPPMVSAIKYKGKPLYKLARRGIEVPRASREIIIHSIKLLKFYLPDISFKVSCSKGTYVRSLGEDIAKHLACGGHISKITRLSVGPFELKDSISLEKINESYIRPWQD